MAWFSLRKKHPYVNRMFRVLLEKGFEGAFINKVYQEGYTIYANIHIPEHKECSDLAVILPNLQQELNATAVKFGKTKGKSVEILFGMRELDKTLFNLNLLNNGTLKVEFPSAYGSHSLDFEDGASCHLLNGGTTRMGKTCFLLYLATTIFLQTKGDVKFYISSAKLKDYYPFMNLSQVKMVKDEAGMIDLLNDIILEYKKRDAILYSPSFRKATDAKSIRESYPEHYHLFKPIFLIIDEYARFAKNNEIQEKVTEIVETAGFVNVHVIIASQRPDASTVLKPRIRANLLARMAFTTADAKNSEVILDRTGAEMLGKIAGRGLLLDSDLHVVQVPYLEATECDLLLEQYRKDVLNEEKQERSVNSGNIDEVQSVQQESPSMDDMSREQQSGERSESSIETYDIEWLYNSNTEGEG